MQVHSTVWGLRSHTSRGQETKTQKKKKYCNKFNKNFQNGSHQQKIFNIYIKVERDVNHKRIPSRAMKKPLIVRQGWGRKMGSMAAHSSILAWSMPRTEEPGGLQSMGSQRVRQDWSDLAHMHACTRKKKAEHQHFWWGKIASENQPLLGSLLELSGPALGSPPELQSSPAGLQSSTFSCRKIQKPVLIFVLTWLSEQCVTRAFWACLLVFLLK